MTREPEERRQEAKPGLYLGPKLCQRRIIAHSGAGLVISEAGAHQRVGHLVYLAAFLLAPDVKQSEMAAGLVWPTLDVRDGVSISRGEPGRPVFYNDCSDADSEWAIARLRPMFMGGRPVDPPRQAWQHKSSTYVVCSLDGATPPHNQRLMSKTATAVIQWPTGHSPFINRPDLVADLLVNLATT